MFCQVSIRVNNGGAPRDVWFAAWTENPTLSDLLREIREEGDCHLIRYDTRPLQGGLREVTGTSETIQSRESIVSVSEMQFDLVDRAGTVLFARAGQPGAAARP